MKTNLSKDEVAKALFDVNYWTEYDIVFNRCQQIGKWFYFTIKSSKSGLKGTKKNIQGHKTVNLDYTAHGVLFEAMLKIRDDCVVVTSYSTINKNNGVWQDIPEIRFLT